MTIAELATLMLGHFAPEERTVPDHADFPGRNAAVADAINEGLQEVFLESKAFIRRDERGHLTHAPTTVPITVTNGSRNATIEESDWQAWFAGCSIVIDGSAIDNQIRNEERNVVLKFPHDGPTGVTAGTVYFDSITLDPDVIEVIDPVMIDGVRLAPIAGGADSLARQSLEDYKFHQRESSTRYPMRLGSWVGLPVGYAVETYSPGTAAVPLTRLKVFPPPSGAGSLSYDARLNPPMVSDLASSNELPIPHKFVNSILKPIVRFHLSKSPFYRHGGGESQVASGYQNARLLLSKLNPGKRSGARFRTLY